MRVRVRGCVDVCVIHVSTQDTKRIVAHNTLLYHAHVAHAHGRLLKWALGVPLTIDDNVPLPDPRPNFVPKDVSFLFARQANNCVAPVGH